MGIHLERRRIVIKRSRKLGHCVCDPSLACPCPALVHENHCFCAGETKAPNHAAAGIALEPRGAGLEGASPVNEQEVAPEHAAQCCPPASAGNSCCGPDASPDCCTGTSQSMSNCCGPNAPPGCCTDADPTCCTPTPVASSCCGPNAATDCCAPKGAAPDQTNNAGLDAFQDFLHAAEQPGLIDENNKKLMAIALSVAVQSRPCLVMHLAAAIKLGIPKPQIDEAANLAVAFGGCSAMMLYHEACRALDLR